jgi:diadenosine hexaphosphate hydrolase (ATP-forming)
MSNSLNEADPAVFKKLRTVTQGAGGVVFNAVGKILLVRDYNCHWLFPKGHVDAKEPLAAAALCEVREEAGISARILAPLPDTSYINARGVQRHIHWFLMYSEEKPSLTAPGELLEVGFFTVTEALKKPSFPQDIGLLARAIRDWRQRHERASR